MYIPENPFWADLASHLLLNGDFNFMTQNIIYLQNSLSEAIFGLAVLGITDSKPHKYVATDGKGV